MSVAIPVIDYIDPINRKIYLLPGVTEYSPVDDIYKEVRNLRRTDESLRQYPNFVSAGGNLPKNLAGTSRTPRFAIFNNTQVVVSGDTFVTGEQLFANAAGELVGSGRDIIDRTLSPADAYVDYAPPEAEVIVVSGGSALTPEERIWLQELWRLAGLDPSVPMTVTQASRVAGAINLLLTGDGETTTTVTRQP